MTLFKTRLTLLAGFVVASGAAMAQDTTASTQPEAPAPLVLYFSSGSSDIRPEDRSVLDQASRAYSQGKPIVMIVTGTADRVGSPSVNLVLSQRRATAVVNGLMARGIPAERFQVLAKGETEPAVATDEGVAELQNRRVEITWR
jgi:outer membrane protein OmpA-like peptidoglycan-associated protein